jgi:endonuclease G
MTTTIADMVALGTLAATVAASAAAASGPRTTPPDEFEDRHGFDPAFLDPFEVALPSRVGDRAGDEAPLLDGSGHELTYEHFSIVMSASRRIAIFTACNIAGNESVKIKRSRDVWALDGRIDVSHQVGEALYTDNRLDRGHLVRREDPVWGDSAARANDDTFHFTNCSPQYDEFNQQLWLGLENYILKNSRAHGLRISVFTGPVFRDDDMLYRGVQIPREYWKVIALVTEDGRPSATAYKISQADLLDEGLAFVFGKYKTYQVSISHVESLSSLDFGNLRGFDGLSGQEMLTSASATRELTDWREILI